MRDTTSFKNSLQTVFPALELPGPVVQALAAAAVPRRFEAGQVIYVEGEPAETLFILESGWVKATRMTREGREQAMMFMHGVDVFGDVAVFAGTTYPGTVVALESVKVWALPARTILDWTLRSPELSQAVIRHLARRVTQYVNLVEDLSLRSVDARLANNLLQKAELKDGRFTVPRRDWTTFDEMAVRLGTVRDVLSRALKVMEAEGLLRVEKHAIILLDPKGLTERARR